MVLSIREKEIFPGGDNRHGRTHSCTDGEPTLVGRQVATTMTESFMEGLILLPRQTTSAILNFMFNVQTASSRKEK